MRAATWWIAVTLFGVIGTTVALLAGGGAVPGAAVIVPLGCVPLTALALAFVGLARTSAVASYAIVTVVALGAPIADLWSRSAAAGNADEATWLGLTCSIAVALSGLLATLLSRAQPRSERPGSVAPESPRGLIPSRP